MNRTTLAWGVPLVAVIGLFVGSLASSVSTHSSGRFLAASAATPVFFQQGAGPGWSSRAAGGSNRNHLPNSTLVAGALFPVCSVDTSDTGNPPSCSTSNSSNGNCSARCDMDQICSAFWTPNGNQASAQCSVLGFNGGLCSVLQPANAQIGPSFCSVDGGPPGTSLQCSVMRAGQRQICSAENPARLPDNNCSTRGTMLAVPGNTACSVLAGGPQRNFCSVGGNVTGTALVKRCSTFTPNSECSIRVGNRGICTNFQATPAGSCSTHSSPAHCSVIGGAPGTFCVQ